MFVLRAWAQIPLARSHFPPKPKRTLFYSRPPFGRKDLHFFNYLRARTTCTSLILYPNMLIKTACPLSALVNWASPGSLCSHPAELAKRSAALLLVVHQLGQQCSECSGPRLPWPDRSRCEGQGDSPESGSHAPHTECCKTKMAGVRLRRGRGKCRLAQVRWKLSAWGTDSKNQRCS